MSASCFVDTNILVYAHDRSTGVKHDVASELVADLWQQRTGVVSTQVLQELYVNLRRKVREPLPRKEAASLIRDYLRWDVVVNNGDSLLQAMDVEDRYGIGFWDALIVQAAASVAADVLYSEDLSHEQRYGTVRVVNPFRT